MICAISKTETDLNKMTKIDGMWVRFEYYHDACNIAKKNITSYTELIEILNLKKEEKNLRTKLMEAYFILYRNKEIDLKTFTKNIAEVAIKRFKKYPNCLTTKEYKELYEELLEGYKNKYKDKYPALVGGWKDAPAEATGVFYLDIVPKRDWILESHMSKTMKEVNKEMDKLNGLVK